MSYVQVLQGKLLVKGKLKKKKNTSDGNQTTAFFQTRVNVFPQTIQLFMLNIVLKRIIKIILVI